MRDDNVTTEHIDGRDTSKADSHVESTEHSILIVGERSCIDSGVELKDTLMSGADYYQTESEIASLLANGKVPIGTGSNTKIM
ncbi:hypothetical protein M8C21_016122 [Ambrosia artemisiifolia]|uniref:Uncharacterized protein n=1 Tax=Ambrosia artemisiifolia TaxID=4212 RepID=A0AAD5BWH0_AMBAR|nr:hypothetical protein M8C21_016122 [Ambrosia artemisiifolia]